MGLYGCSINQASLVKKIMISSVSNYLNKIIIPFSKCTFIILQDPTFSKLHMTQFHGLPQHFNWFTWCESQCQWVPRPPGTPWRPRARLPPGNYCTYPQRFHDGSLSWLQPTTHTHRDRGGAACDTEKNSWYGEMVQYAVTMLLCNKNHALIPKSVSRS